LLVRRCNSLGWRSAFDVEAVSSAVRLEGLSSAGSRTSPKASHKVPCRGLRLEGWPVSQGAVASRPWGLWTLCWQLISGERAG
jgi:hypothetical protein